MDCAAAAWAKLADRHPIGEPRLVSGTAKLPDSRYSSGSSSLSSLSSSSSSATAASFTTSYSAAMSPWVSAPVEAHSGGKVLEVTKVDAVVAVGEEAALEALGAEVRGLEANQRIAHALLSNHSFTPPSKELGYGVNGGDGFDGAGEGNSRDGFGPGSSGTSASSSTSLNISSCFSSLLGDLCCPCCLIHFARFTTRPAPA